MFRNYLMIAIRNFSRTKAYSAINILGLAVGMACCILILQYIRYELAYDQQHTKGERIYRVLRGVKKADGQAGIWPIVSGPLGAAMMVEIPEVQKTARYFRHDIPIKYEDQHFKTGFALVDPSFFQLFDFQMVGGIDPALALKQPNTILLTEHSVKRFFKDENPIGKTVSALAGMARGDYVVAGVLEDYESAIFDFDFISTHPPSLYFPNEIWDGWLPGTWRMTNVFALLQKNANIQDVENRLAAIMLKNLGSEVFQTDQYRLQAFTRIHLYSETDFGIVSERTITQLYLLGIVAGLVILIACVNFINLSTARSMRRAREVGTRKVFGAQRSQLINQFMTESILIASLSGGFAFLIAHLALPYFNAFVKLNLSLGFDFLPYLIGIAIIVGLFAGSYPAFYLSGFQPITTLKGSQRSVKTGYLRRALVVFQFATSLLLIVGTVIVYYQLNYVSTYKLGYNTSGVISVPMPKALDRHKRDRGIIRKEFMRHPNVLGVTTSTWNNLMNPSRGTVARTDKETEISVLRIQPDSNFLETFQLRLKAGRNFQMKPRLGREGPDEFLINETAARALGWDMSSNDQTTSPVGQPLRLFGSDQLRLYKKKELLGTIVGVVEDFHYQSMHYPIRPLIISPSFYAYFIHLRIRTTNISETLTFVKETHEKLQPGEIFSYEFLDEKIAKAYDKEHQTATISFISAGLAIFIACLGLFGLAAFATEQRSKEIGIRKVLGASVPSILKLLLGEFLWLIIVANFIALPVAYLFGRNWLDSFAYRIDLSANIFILSGLIVGVLAFLTVIYQSFKAATSNPTEVIRSE